MERSLNTYNENGKGNNLHRYGHSQLFFALMHQPNNYAKYGCKCLSFSIDTNEIIFNK